MNVNLLIDAIVRQTTVLIAQLATAAGARATLAHTANQVFADLVDELKAQGLGNKVIADMFGLSLRTYQHKVARLSESTTERGRSLWEALLAFVQRRTTVLRSELLDHFSHDDELKVRGVLQDLVDSGLVFRSGRGDATLYRAATLDEYAFPEGAGAAERLAHRTVSAAQLAGPRRLRHEGGSSASPAARAAPANLAGSTGSEIRAAAAPHPRWRASTAVRACTATGRSACASAGVA